MRNSIINKPRGTQNREPWLLWGLICLVKMAYNIIMSEEDWIDLEKVYAKWQVSLLTNNNK